MYLLKVYYCEERVKTVLESVTFIASVIIYSSEKEAGGATWWTNRE